MPTDRDALRDYHRLFGLLLADFFTGSPFVVEVERDLSVQQQFLDVVIVRRTEGTLKERLPDGLEGLRDHNLITFKSHHEALDDWAVKELIGHYVAYRKLISPSPRDLVPENHFGLYAVAARFPQGLSGLVPWERVQVGVYDCRWGTDTVRVVVAGELPREPHNAPLHLFSARTGLIDFGRRAYRLHSPTASGLLVELFADFQAEGLAMPFTIEDFNRQFVQKHFAELAPQERVEALRKLPPEERKDVIKSLPPEERLADLTDEQIRQYLERRSAKKPAPPRKPRRKK
jgi:hypothetical protein